MKLNSAITRFRASSQASKLVSVMVVLVVAALGYMIVSSRAATNLGSSEAEQATLSGPASIVNDATASGAKALQFGVVPAPTPNPTPTPTTGLLKPLALGFAPYAYIPWGDVNMTSYASATGVKNFFGAFVNNTGSCTPAWDGDSSLTLASTTGNTILTDIQSVRAKGGDVAVSFGGQMSTDADLADKCTSASALQTALQSVISKYSLTHINFDIEGAPETNSAGLARRIQALVALQQANPNLKVSLTIPVEPSGLDSQALAVVKQMHDGGVALSSIDIMSMDFGVSGAQTNPVQSSATGTVSQLQKIYTTNTTADIWKALGVIVMIGQNDDGQVFSLQDAQNIRNFATQNGLGTLSMWSANRDFQCSGTRTFANGNCSGITQNNYAFSSIFNGSGSSGGSGGGSTTPTATSLFNASKKEIAMELVSSAENSSLNWKAQYAYIEDIGDGRGYTAGIIGFCSGTGDMLEMVQYYNTIKPGNILAKYIPALQQVNGTASHTGLGDAFVADWKTAAKDTQFQAAQNYERDTTYFNPAVNQAIADGLRALGQFIYYDAIVMHGPGNDSSSFGGIRANAMKKAKTPAQGGDEKTYLNAFLDVRKAAMLTEEAHSDTSRVDNEQRVFLQNNNFDLNPPLNWSVYGDPYSILTNP